MAGDTLGEVIRRLSRLSGLQGDLAQTDAQLLDRFARRREEPAFAALLARHGAMVLGLCRRLLHDPRDAEDAFQAAFLILARKAGEIRRQALLGAWLYGVAWRVAVRLRGRIARRRERERPVLDLDALPADDAAWSEARWVVHEEVQRLPEVYRSAIILCCLEGRTNEEAARLLRRPVGTVKSRLTRGREILRSRLTRRGLAVSAGAVGAALAVDAASASAALVDATVQAATQFTAGTAAAVRAVILARGVLRTMMLTKSKTAAVLALAVALLTAAGGYVYRTAAGEANRVPATAARADRPAAADKAPDDKEKPADKPRVDGDKANIQGVWRITTIVMGGKEQDDAQARVEKEEHYVFTADRFVIRYEIQVNTDEGPRITQESVYTYDLDPTRTPKVLDVWPQYAPFKGKVLRGVYSLEGDVLKLCQIGPDGERPKEVASKEGDVSRLLILKRVKPDDDRDALQGTWKVDSVRVAGRQLTDQELAGRGIKVWREWVVRGDAVEFGDDAVHYSCPFRLDATKEPRTIDLDPMAPGYTADRKKGPPNRGVYLLDGDEWQICFPRGTDLVNSPGADVKRPTEVASVQEADGTPPVGTMLITLRRVKPDKEKPKDDKPAQAKAPDGAHYDIIADATQPAGSPVLLKLVLTNRGKEPLTYWVGGPADYPPINIPTRATDAAGKTREAPLSNGQALGGSGIVKSLGPGDSLTTPAAIPPLPAGDYRIEVGDAVAAITIKDDPDLLKKREDNLFARICKGELFARHVAVLSMTPSLRDRLLNELSATDSEAACEAALTFGGVENLPADVMPLVARGMEKQAALEESRRERTTNVLIWLADIAARIGTDEALDAVLKLAHSDRGRDVGVGALGRFKQERAVQALHDFLKSPDKELRRMAAFTLAGRRDPAAIDELLAVIANDSSTMREFACRALVNFPDDPRAEPAIRGLLDDIHVRDAARDALQELQAAKKK